MASENELQLPDIAERLRAAFESQDPALLFSLLDPDVRWGADGGGERSCRNRGQVLRWYAGLFASGMRAQVTDTALDADAVILTFAIAEQASDRPPRGDQVRQRFTVSAGRVIDIRDQDEGGTHG
jgi:hypothetical protein